MNERNYQKEMEKILSIVSEKGERPSLLLHACCAPCASACLMRLMEACKVTVFYFNPNITDREEYEKRAAEVQKLIRLMNEEYRSDLSYMAGAFSPELFYETAKGLEDVPEGGERCFACYGLRLRETAMRALDGDFSYFATTLTLSPLKNAAKINEIAEGILSGIRADDPDTKLSYLPSDFKKKDGYRLSVELSEKYGLYRQNYCGCEFSKRHDLVMR
jgi:predicted adenine nucleotide alpha hydrolase (AANH) superfamily ATPase